MIQFYKSCCALCIFCFLRQQSSGFIQFHGTFILSKVMFEPLFETLFVFAFYSARCAIFSSIGCCMMA